MVYGSGGVFGGPQALDHRVAALAPEAQPPVLGPLQQTLLQNLGSDAQVLGEGRPVAPGGLSGGQVGRLQEAGQFRVVALGTGGRQGDEDGAGGVGVADHQAGALKHAQPDPRLGLVELLAYCCASLRL